MNGELNMQHTLFFYKQWFFWSEARLLLTHHEKAASKFACMLLRYTCMKSFKKKIPILQQLVSFSHRTEIMSGSLTKCLRTIHLSLLGVKISDW